MSSSIIIASSWYQAIRNLIEDEKMPILINYRQEFHEFVCLANQFRTITLKRSRRSWKHETETNYEDPPFVWAIWSEHLSPPMQGYFEEISVRPTSENELVFMLEIMKLWLIDFKDYASVQKLAQEKHPRFSVDLAEHRKNK